MPPTRPSRRLVITASGPRSARIRGSSSSSDLPRYVFAFGSGAAVAVAVALVSVPATVIGSAAVSVSVIPGQPPCSRPGLRARSRCRNRQSSCGSACSTSRRRWRRARAEQEGRDGTLGERAVELLPSAAISAWAPVGLHRELLAVGRLGDRFADLLLDRRVERDRPQAHRGVEVRRRDRPAERLPRVLGEQRRIAGEARLVADLLDDRAEVADRHALAEQRLQHPLDLAERELVGDDLLDRGGVGLLQPVEQLARLLAGEQLGGVAADRLGQVGDDDRSGSTTV